MPLELIAQLLKECIAALAQCLKHAERPNRHHCYDDINHDKFVSIFDVSHVDRATDLPKQHSNVGERDYEYQRSNHAK